MYEKPVSFISCVIKELRGRKYRENAYKLPSR